MWTPFRPRQRKSSSRQPLRGTRVPRFEPLEARLALATYNVISSADSGAGTLRQAILDANVSSGADHIQFNIPGGGVRTIQPLSPLPSITDAVTIDGYTQSGASPNTLATGDNAVLLIALNGNLAGQSHGLLLSAGSSTVRGLVINGFSESGILITSSSGNLIEGNFIGTSAFGSAGAGNGSVGIWIHGGGNDTIGGSTPGARNVISGSGLYGIFLDSASNNQVQGNYVGTDAAGVHAVPNGFYGINISDGSHNRVEDNVFSGNGDLTLPYDFGPGGIAIGGFFNPCEYNTVANNKIGVGADGTTPVPNLQGVAIGGGAQHNTIEGNVIAHNIWQGVQFSPDFLPRPTPTSDNVLRNNQITNNGGNGVEVFAGNGLTYDWITTQAFTTIPDNGTQRNSIVNNYISGNGGIGVIIDGIRGNDNTVYGNTIASNGSYGVQISGGAQGNQIGGTGSGLTNSIHDNSGAGVMVRDLGYDLNLQFFPGMEHGEYTANGPFSPTANSIVHPINNAIRGNAIYNNGGPAIDLNNDGITFNDPNDSDIGPNNLQNWPVITVARSGASTFVVGILHSLPGTSFTLDFYASSAAGQRWLDSLTATTNGSGDASFSGLLSAATAAGEVVVATATDPNGNTSEFSLGVTVTDLVVTGTAANDAYVLSAHSPTGAVEVLLNGVSQGIAGQIFLSDPNGSDTYTVNFGGWTGNVILSGGAGTDTLNLNGTVAADQFNKQFTFVDWNLDATPSTTSRVNYTGIETFNVFGGDGNDTILDPAEDTNLFGGAGDDTIIIDATFGNGVVVDGGEGSDNYVVMFGNLAGPVTVADSGTTGVDSLEVQGTAGDDAITLAGNEVQRGAERVIIAAPVESLVVNAGDGSDTLSVVDFTAPISSLGLDGGAGTNQVSVEGSLPPGVELDIVGATQTVQIDVLRDTLNLASNGRIAVAIFTTANFNAAQVDAGSVVFAGAHAVHSAMEDADGDGDLDLVLHFRTQDTNLRALYEQLLVDDINGDGVLDSNHQSAEVTLTGQTVDDVLVEGFDELDLFLSGKSLRGLLDELAAARVI